MRKLILISALLLASASAQAGETRSLSLAGIPTVTTTAASTGVGFEPAKPIAQVSVRLAQAATTASDAAPVTVQTPPPAAIAQAPAVTTTATPAATTATTAATTSTPAATTTESKPKSTKKARRESDEQKARRIAAKYGVYW